MAMNEGNDGKREGIWDLLDELEEDELMSYAQVLESEGVNSPPMPIDLAWVYLFLYRKTEENFHLDICLRQLNEALETGFEEAEELVRRIAQLPNSLMLIATRGLEAVFDATLAIDGTLINYRDNNGQNPLHQAAATGDLRAVNMLVGRATNVNAVDAQCGFTALHLATQNDHYTIIQSLMQNGCDPNIQDPNGTTPLHLATALGLDRIVSLLISERADVDLMDRDGDTALHISASRGFENIAELLLSENRGDRTLKVNGHNGWTPLQQALVYKKERVADLLLSHGAWPDLQDDTNTHLDEIVNGDIMNHIERSQQMAIQDPTIYQWAKSLRFVVRNDKSSIANPKLKLIEPGEDGTAAEPYVAISYCWGQYNAQEKRLQIEVPSRSRIGTTEMRETRASSEVLRRALDFAASKGLRRIWIDQECIHQDDPEDKGRAIHNMHLVYCQAKYTLVLLGEHIQSSADIRSLSQLITGTKNEFNDLKVRILEDKWFTRAWTTQELAISPRENVLFLIRWKTGLDEEGVEWREAVAESQGQNPLPQQRLSREWELTFDDIPIIASTGCYEGLQKIQGLATNLTRSGNPHKPNEKLFTLLDEEVNEMRWYCRGATLSLHHNKMINPVFKSPLTKRATNLIMLANSAAMFLDLKQCAIFADKLVLLGNIAGYDLRLDQQKVLNEKVSFSACFIALALLNGDLSMLFSGSSLRNSETSRPNRMPLFGEFKLHQPSSVSQHLVAKKVFYSGSKCLCLGKQLLVEGIFWNIQHYSEFEGIEAVHKPKDPSPQDRTQFYQSFFQQLSHRLFTLGRQDILEIVIVVFLHRQLVSPAELFRYLQELQEWFHKERPWPAHIVEESYLQRKALRDSSVRFWDGRELRLTEMIQLPGNDTVSTLIEGVDSYGVAGWLHERIMSSQPITLGTCKLGNETIVSLFTCNADDFDGIVTPTSLLEYEFGDNPWLHLNPNDSFFCVRRTNETPSPLSISKANGILGESSKFEISDQVLNIEGTGTQLGVHGVWSPRLSRNGMLGVGDDGKSWEMKPLNSASKYFWLSQGIDNRGDEES
ncbi:hypothetical protein BHYA_0054g00270 [Botrytis hyacinthi]|uniref:Heterokaryon incompatibility domain-containing protein n=1 Tax=Botrytis hyacinthi TaxID=278943 RepID=A0A4Z1GWK2_9HELO|nr:hypothetical protein BHYA_0054g00270 [Botrytis hyacinthi]